MDNSRSYLGGTTTSVGAGHLDVMNVTNALRDTTIGSGTLDTETDNARNRFLASRRFVGVKG
jgi:hypothetical protein